MDRHIFKKTENWKVECFKIFFQKLSFGPHTKISPVNRLRIKFEEIIATLYSYPNCRTVENKQIVLNNFILVKTITVCHEIYQVLIFNHYEVSWLQNALKIVRKCDEENKYFSSVAYWRRPHFAEIMKNYSSLNYALQ